MPRDTRLIMWVLDEKPGSPTQNVGPEDLFHRIKNGRVADQFVQPGEDQMWLSVDMRWQFSPLLRLQLFQFRS